MTIAPENPVKSDGLTSAANAGRTQNPNNQGSSAFSFWHNEPGSGQYLNGIDFLFPGTTALDNIFDLSGRKAASQQASAQYALDNAARAFSANEAQKQRDWEKMMSDTAIQRQAADYKAAGLNPWLAVQRGGIGAAVPTGSSAQSNSGQANKADNKLLAAAGIIATALRVFLAKH